MRSTLWILLIFMAPFVAGSIEFDPPLYSESPIFPQLLEERCSLKYPNDSDPSKSCLSLCRYKDNDGKVNTFGNANCDVNGEIVTYDLQSCTEIQKEYEKCIPECADHPGTCIFPRIPGWNPKQLASEVVPPLENYSYTLGDFHPPLRTEIKEYRHELCTEAYKDTEEENSPTKSCFSFCRYRLDDSGQYLTYGKSTKSKCNPDESPVTMTNQSLCSEFQDKLQKCIPECGTCTYTSRIAGFNPALSDDDDFDLLPYPHKFNLQYFSEMKISKMSKRIQVCESIYQKGTEKGTHCMSYCLFTKEGHEHKAFYIGKNTKRFCDINLGFFMANYNNVTWCQSVQETYLDGQCPAECTYDSNNFCTTTTSSVTSTTTTTVATTTTTSDPSTTAKVAPTTTKMTDIPGPVGIPTYGPEPTDEEPKEATVDPRNNQRATDPGPSVDGDKKEEGGGPNLKFLWILLPVALLLLVGGGVAGFLVRRRLKAKKSKGKSKTVEVEMGTLPPPPSMQTKKPPSRKRPYFKVSQVDETIPPREMPPGPITKKFKFEGALDLDATGTHGKTTHQLDGAKSHSLRDVMFSDQMNRVFDMGSQVENIIPSPPREGVGEGGGQGGQQQGQEGGGRQGEQGQQGGQGAKGAQSQGGQAPTDK